MDNNTTYRINEELEQAVSDAASLRLSPRTVIVRRALAVGLSILYGSDLTPEVKQALFKQKELYKSLEKNYAQTQQLEGFAELDKMT